MSAILPSMWLRCDITPGMLPAEYAVEVDTTEAGRISLFVNDDKVRADGKHIHVQRLDEGRDNGVLIRLPGQPFEISSRNVRVASELLDPFHKQ